MDPEAIVGKLTRAWSASDRDERRRLLAECCEPDAEFLSPNGPNHGIEAYARGIDIFRASFPKAQVAHAAPEGHHRFLRFAWRTTWNDGRAPLDGVDFGEVSERGRLRRLVSFDGAARPKESGRPASTAPRPD